LSGKQNANLMGIFKCSSCVQGYLKVSTYVRGGIETVWKKASDWCYLNFGDQRLLGGLLHQVCTKPTPIGRAP